MKLEIISPEKTIFSGEVESVTVPGALSSFTVLDRHAPIISPLVKGRISYKQSGHETDIQIESGFIEVKNNIVTICIEKELEPEKK